MLALIKTNPFSAVNTVLLVAILAVSVNAREHAHDAGWYARFNSERMDLPPYGATLNDTMMATTDVVNQNSRKIDDVTTQNANELKLLNIKIDVVGKAVRSNKLAMKDISDAILWSCSS